MIISRTKANLSLQKYEWDGLYSGSDIAKYIRVPVKQIRQWSYTLRRNTDGGGHWAVRNPKYGRRGRDTAYNFQNLLELKAVKMLREAGVSWQAIRKAVRKIKKYYKNKAGLYPLAYAAPRLRYDKKAIVLCDGENRIDLLNDNQIEHEVLSRYLKHFNRKNPDETAVFWPWFDKNGVVEKSIVMDPERSYGEPIIDKHRMPTAVLYGAFHGSDMSSPNDGIKFVSDLYDLPCGPVKKAVDFETWLKSDRSNTSSVALVG